MRIWHEKLIPYLCQKHLCAMWREGLGCYKIVNEGKKGYSRHPATVEFLDSSYAIFKRLCLVRREMLARGYHPKEIPPIRAVDMTFGKVRQWQTLREQKRILKAKGCKCKI